jgi:SAM-dependent methyltransferase
MGSLNAGQWIGWERGGRSVGIIVLVSDLWRFADVATGRFAAQARDYDRYRPRYPEGVFDDIVDRAHLASGDHVVEIGAGTGIATRPLVDRGLRVTAIEPSDTLAAMARAKVSGEAEVVNGRFEDFSTQSPFQLVTAFNAWHWVNPSIGVDRAAGVLESGGSLALVWTEVVQWGEEPFGDRLVQVFDQIWNKRESFVDDSLQPIREDRRFEDVLVRHHIFHRTLDATAFVAVTRTYGGDHTAEQYRAIERIIDHDFGGAVTKTEDAVLYLTRRS